MKERILEIALKQGFSAFGVARCHAVSPGAAARSRLWLDTGMNGCLDYMERYPDLRLDPSALLEGCRSVVVMAASYYFNECQSYSDARVARYARGDDYHEVLRRLASPITDFLASQGHTSRICVDTAPIPERYWAVEAGVGFIGRNGCLIVPGIGSYCFLTLLLTDAPLEPDEPCSGSCAGCGACLKACPSGALQSDGLIDCRRCLSCLTIEYRGDFPDDFNTGGRVFGCDTCQDVCPHNRNIPESLISEFRMRDAVRDLTIDRILEMEQPEFSSIFTHSAVKRTKLAGLRRNAAHADKR